MDHHGGKIAAGLFCLVVVWIIVFWLWTPAEPRISYGTTETAAPVQPVSGYEPESRPRLPPVVTDPIKTPPESRQPTRREPSQTNPPVTTGVIAPEFTDYTVQPGETFASIAQKFFGSRGKAEVIASANPLVDPTRIRAGRVIRIPKDPANIQGRPTAKAPASAPESAKPSGQKTYTVAPGDTLSGISRDHYGTSKHTDLILKANRNVIREPKDLRAGQVLVIPPAPQ